MGQRQLPASSDMCQTDITDNELESPQEKARKGLQQKIAKHKVKRYYRTAKNLNFGESQNLGVMLKTLSNAEHEYEREFSANQRIFKINRRRHIESLVHIKVEKEIESLEINRHQSTMLSKLNIAHDIEEAAKKVTTHKDTSETDLIEVSPLPHTVTAALHEGVPTILSRPKIIKRIKTAPAYGRRHITLPQDRGAVNLSDPLRLLERVENSDGFIGIRNRLARKPSGRTVSSNTTHHKEEKILPDYLALDPLEASVIRANLKRQTVERCKLLHAGNDERCSLLVKKWIQDFNLS